MRWIVPARRFAIYARDAFRCVYCGATGQLTGKGIVLDHEEPKSRFGGNASANLVTACYSCNSKKRDRCAAEWFADEKRPRNERERVYRRLRKIARSKVDFALGRVLAASAAGDRSPAA